ncbi:MAG: glycine--tRNA ligase subunit beta [Thermodesulfobacteriota bacterium]
MEQDLILEIGTEEIPAGFLNQALTDLKDIAVRELRAKDIAFKEARSFGTPRRLTLHITGVLDKQPDKTVESLGPPKRIAYDREGNPTKAAIGFAKSQGVSPGELVLLKNDKGEFAGARKRVKGEKTVKLLESILPGVVLSIPFRKSMRWGVVEIDFVRPIRWLLALFGGKTVPFSIGDIKTAKLSYGHRFLSPRQFRVSGWDDYTSGLESRFVILDQDKRKSLIRKQTQKLAAEVGGHLEEDEELLETVTNLVEYPVVLVGSFEEEYLSLPKEVLISVMKHHQKYFPLYADGGERLLPNFIFVSGTKVKDPRLVIEGNERVIRARFNDAKFFYDEDTKTPLSEKKEALKGMVYLSELGNYHDKTRRIAKLASLLGKKLDFEQESRRNLVRAAELAKADLATQMVFEFPELEGTMGKYYARASGEDDTVGIAIEEHYMPRTRDGAIPSTDVGSVLSICDKADNISACFTRGLIPTGASDPYALRRQAIGIINIILDWEYRLSLKEIFENGLELIQHQIEAGNKRAKKFSSPEEALNLITDFVKERYRNILTAEGFPADVVDAVLSCGCDDLLDTKRKIQALAEFMNMPDFDSLAIAFKRVVNIVEGAQNQGASKELMSEQSELSLYESYCAVKADVQKIADDGDYPQILSLMKGLKKPIDAFFDNVLVMEKDEVLRTNRLALLWGIRELFFTVANFSKIST